ncbi:MAG: type III-A CRISPR-associated protein Csm2 [Candidatus Accumulibacter sp.]|jgi:CRISPR-associated protein Csm2|nr:type III-A CRISPR-associated protein Csm2 [Accumulibacter sp.]
MILDPLSEDIFSDVALEEAQKVAAEASTTKNNSSQLRKFYDELVMWHDKLFDHNVKDKEKTYKDLAPFIKMMCAKVAYAKGRGHVGAEFERLFTELIKAIKNPTTLKHAKLFMEAFMGFYKAKER